MRNLSKETGLDKLGATFKRAGGRMVNFFKTGVKWAGALTVALAGIALKGGFTRAMNIEDAEAKLKGLGHSTQEITSIMDDALASVKGTAFGLDEAASLAGSAVAAGIQPGKELEKQLTLVADSAALAGTDMGEMGSIFTKVWTSGRVGTEELNQLADRGIPIWTALADQFGVTTDELRKMVSSGEVDAAAFATAMEDTVGGSALAMGDTTRGAWKNMMAALSRAGASFLTGIFPMFKDGMTGITGLLDNLAPYAEKAGKAIGGWITNVAVPAIESFLPKLGNIVGAIRDRIVPAVEALANVWDSQVQPAMESAGDYIASTLVPKLREMASWVEDNKEKLIAGAAAIAAFVAGYATTVKIQAAITTLKAVRTAVIGLNAALLANPIALVVAAVAALTAGLVWFFTQTETGKAMWDTIWPQIQATAQAVADWFTGTFLPAVQNVWNTIVEVATAAADWFQTHVGPVISASIDLAIAIFERLQEAWGVAWGYLQSTWDAIGAPVMAVVKGAFNSMKIHIETVFNIVKSVIETALAVIAGIIRAITAAVKGDWSAVWNEVKGVASSIWNGIKDVISIAIQGVKDQISNVVGTIKSFLSSSWSTIKSQATTGWNNFKNAISDAWDRTIDAVTNSIDTVILWVKGLPGRAVSALGNIGSTLWSAGKDLIQGFIDGLTSMFGAVKDKLSSLTSWLPSWKGPASRDRTLLKEAGRLVIGGFIEGMEGQYGNVQRSLQGLTRNVANTRFQPFTADLATAGAGGAGATPTISLDGVRIEGELDLRNGAAYIMGVLRQQKREHAQSVADVLPMVATIPGAGRGAASLVQVGVHTSNKYGGQLKGRMGR